MCLCRDEGETVGVPEAGQVDPDPVISVAKRCGEGGEDQATGDVDVMEEHDRRLTTLVLGHVDGETVDVGGVFELETHGANVLGQVDALVGDRRVDDHPGRHHQQDQEHHPADELARCVFLRRGLQAFHRNITMCTCLGPCTPRLSVCSMSPVRLGPVTMTRLVVSRADAGFSRAQCAKVRDRVDISNRTMWISGIRLAKRGRPSTVPEDNAPALGETCLGPGHPDLQRPVGEQVLASALVRYEMVETLQSRRDQSRCHPGCREVVPGDEVGGGMSRSDPDHRAGDSVTTHRAVDHGADRLGAFPEQRAEIDFARVGEVRRHGHRQQRSRGSLGHSGEEGLTVHGSPATSRGTTLSPGAADLGSPSIPGRGREDV